jgi:hypothetical protein
MSLKEGGDLRDVLLFRGLCIFMVSLVNLISRGLEEFLAARATITPNVKGNGCGLNFRGRGKIEGKAKEAA